MGHEFDEATYRAHHRYCESLSDVWARAIAPLILAEQERNAAEALMQMVGVTDQALTPNPNPPILTS